MIVDETYIGEWPEDDFRNKGIVLEAENKKDSELIEYYLNNKDFCINLLRKEYTKHLQTKSKNTSGLVMSLDGGKTWIDYDSEIHREYSVMGIDKDLLIKRALY